MPDHQGRQDFPEVADEKINIGSFNEWAPLGVSDIYSPKEEPKLRDQVLLDQGAMLKEICTLIESFGKKPAAKKVEDPYKGTSIKKAAGWTMDKNKVKIEVNGTEYSFDKQNPQNLGDDASRSGEKSEINKGGLDLMCKVCKSKIEKGGGCPSCAEKKNLEKAIVKSINNYLV